MKKVSVEKWTMREIADTLNPDIPNNGGKKIVIPRFQRGKKWTEKQKSEFIESLKKGFPVGTLLFYRTNDIGENNKPITIYTLVDGLQRSMAIRDYLDSPMKYLRRENINEDMVNKILRILDFPEQDESNRNKIKNICVNFMKKLPKLSDEWTYDLAKTIVAEYRTDKKIRQRESTVKDELYDKLREHRNEYTDDYETVEKTEIPAVVYSGLEEDLPEIFERINSKGTPLNVYEIYAASWPQTEKFKVKNRDIINYVLKKYDVLNDDNLVVSGYDRGEINRTGMLTIFEYVFGFSKWINEKFPFLSFDSKDNADEISPTGFELLDACIFDSKNVGILYKELQKHDINKLEERIVEAIEFVQETVNPITHFKRNTRRDNPTKLYAKNQILSMIAFVFREKYDINDLSCEREEFSGKKEKIEKQLYGYFIYDIIKKEWYEGSGKLHSYINAKKYLDKISSSAWEQALNGMFEESLRKRETTNIKNPGNIDIVFLNAIYVHKFSASDQLSGDKFDIEHIATKELMKKLIKETCPDDALEGLPVSSIANLCYLPEHQNRAKGGKTFYQDKDYLKNLALEDIERKYSFTVRKDLDWLDEKKYSEGDFEKLRDSYSDFLRNRFERQKQMFFEALGIEPPEHNVADDKNRQQLETAKRKAEKKESIRKPEIYGNIKSRLQDKFGIQLVFDTITTAAGGDFKFAMAYSKIYMQGTRHRYWFAYRPDKIRDSKENKKYFVFACHEDNVCVALPKEVLDRNIPAMNLSDNREGRIHYHIVLFIDNNDGRKSVRWMLSKPEIREEDITEYII